MHRTLRNRLGQTEVDYSSLNCTTIPLLILPSTFLGYRKRPNSSASTSRKLFITIIIIINNVDIKVKLSQITQLVSNVGIN